MTAAVDQRLSLALAAAAPLLHEMDELRRKRLPREAKKNGAGHLTCAFLEPGG